MKKHMFICFAFLAFASTQIFAAEKIKNDAKILEPIGIEIDQVAFDENSLMGIYDDAGNRIANFSRFDNGNSKTKAIKVYDSNKEHLYTISAVDTDGAIYILDKEGNRGKIQINPTLVKRKINITTDVKFFGKPYDFAYFVDGGLGRVSKIYLVSYESKPVIKESNVYETKSGLKSEIIVNKTYLNDNKIECAIWILSLLALDEMSNASQNSNNNGQVN